MYFQGIAEKPGELLETPKSHMRHNATRKGDREGLKSMRIGQSAAEPPRNGWKVQRLGVVVQNGRKPTSPRRESDDVVWTVGKLTEGRIKSLPITQSVYISDAGDHKLVLNRYMRTSIVFGIDPEYVSVAFLDGIKLEDLAKTGDAEKKMLITEFCLVANNPDAHFKIQNLPAV
jgi:hypothetical protein